MAASRPTILSILLLTALSACGGSDRPEPGEIALTDLFTADFALTDMTGEPATDERFEGEPMFIYYGFTTCPEVCPTALATMSASLDALGRDAGRIQPLFITVDPERDTAEKLSAYLAFDDRILGLTGTPEAVDAARESLKVFAAKVPLEDSAMVYTMDHQSMFYVTDAAGKPLYALDDGMPPESIARVIERALRASGRG
ncbi:SCO family protein [Parvularcula dongshanensis]|uniref:Protein SCO1/2 n=1 Tax=Parvularcula dongshanensis TaxID=1173995 RepID=A0A840I195_9PROT|nr:SCO family protein [Parvularcula dongshanensis]MBB4658051.1 protein SCO1/2 [Parvularcula dongshanensis]